MDDVIGRGPRGLRPAGVRVAAVQAPGGDSAYVTLPFRRREDSWGPDLPDGIGFLQLAAPDDGHRFALYVIDGADLPRATSAVPVSDRLAALLRRAEGHLPAMALMRDAVVHRVLEPPTRDRFLWRVERLLERHLAPELVARRILAVGLADELGYRIRGEPYWLVAHSACTSRVSWVSRDYFVYCDPSRGFDASTEELIRLPGAPPLFWPDDEE